LGELFGHPIKSLSPPKLPLPSSDRQYN
jgi:hypothetical protein